MKSSTCFTLALAATGLMWGVSVPTTQGALLFDFGDSQATPDASGGNAATWNTIAFTPGSGSATDNDQTVTGVVSDDGAPAPGVSVHITGFRGQSDEDGDTWAAGDKQWVDADAARDFLYGADYDSGASRTGTITISGLADTAAGYDVSLVSATSSTVNNKIADYQVNGAFTSDEVSSDNFNSKDNWTANGGYLLNWTTDLNANGDLVLDFTEDGRDLFYLNALRVAASPVPEPASLTLLAAGAMCMMTRRRRRA